MTTQPPTSAQLKKANMAPIPNPNVVVEANGDKVRSWNGKNFVVPTSVSPTEQLYAVPNSWNPVPTPSPTPPVVSYTVTFNAEGGTAVPSETVVAGDSIEPPTAPTYSGYNFNGWSNEPNESSILAFPFSVSENITLYAQWTPVIVPPNPVPVTSNPSGFVPTTAPAGYRVVFTDDFLSTAPDETIWGNPYSGNPSNNAKMGKWLPSHLVIANSIANFKMYQDVDGDDPSDANWVGAGIQTRQSFTSGRIDVAMRVDRCPNVSAIALLYHESSSVKDEIDFVETNPAADGSCTEFYASAHYGTGSAQVQKQITGTDLSEWHVWSAEWDETTITYRCDGSPWATFTNPGIVNPMGFCLQFQTGDYGLTMPPVGSTPTMQVDWAAAFVAE